MASYNKVILVGNLTRDPQVRYTPSQTAVVDIGLAVNRQWFDKQANTRREEVTFVDVTLWGRTAEVAGEYLSKGRSVLIEGRLQLDQWEDRETGQKRSKLKVVGENMQMLSGRGDGPPRGGGQQSQDGGEFQDSGPQEPPPPPPQDAFHDEPAAGGAPDDDVPF
jgi:single-strand DNA-binding protein